MSRGLFPEAFLSPPSKKPSPQSPLFPERSSNHASSMMVLTLGTASGGHIEIKKYLVLLLSPLSP